MSEPLPAVRVGEHLGADAPDVTVLRWPAEAQRRRRLAAEGRPRLLVVETGADAPALVDDLEDWVRCPSDAAELLVRTDALRRRAVDRTRAPVLDDDGLLRFDGLWVYIPDRQLALVALLVRRFGRVVPTDEVAAAYTSGGGSARGTSVRTAVVRIRARVAEIGLRLHVLRGRGVVLDVWRDDPPL